MSINRPNGEIFNVIGAVVIDIHQRTQIEKTYFLSHTATKLTLQKLSNNVFSVCVRGCVSITTAPMTIRISVFHSLILGIDVLACFDS